MSLTLIAACLAFVAAPSPADTHVDELHGFRIDVPDGWHKSSQQLDENTFVLQLLPKGSIGDRGVTVTVAGIDAGQDEAFFIERARASANAPDSSIADFEEWDGELAGKPARGIRAVANAPSGRYRIVQSFLLEGDSLYMLQRHAPVADFDGLADGYEAVAATFALVERGADANAEARLIELASRCGSEVDWAADWETAARRARDENKLVVVSAFMIPGFSITDTPRNSTFMDPDVLELVAERFVPFWYERGKKAAFVETYGLGPSSFGQAILVVTPDGRVVQETNAASSPEVVLPFLHAALERNQEFKGAPPAVEAAMEADGDANAVDLAALRVARGEHAQARELLAGDESAAAELLRARMLRREQRGPEALAALEAAYAAGAERTPALDVEEAQIRMREGDRDRARAMLDAVIAEHPDTEAGREARVVRGMFDLPEHRDEAKARWRALALEAPESRWAWVAAAALRSTGLDLDLTPDLGWPHPAAVEEILKLNVPTPLPLARAGEAADGALAWLLAHQDPDGGWSGPTELQTVEGMGPNPFRDATAALAGSALLRRGMSADAEASARRALAYLIASVERRKAEPPLVLFMDYMTWSDAMILRFLADALERGLGDVEGLAPIVQVLVTDMGARQQEGGGWSYYVTSDIEGDGAPSNSISFTTAAAILALARAREVGFRVPKDVLDPALDALERMREPDGTFAYFLFHDTGTTQSGTAPAGAVGRGPACELALFEAGRGTRERVDTALQRFLDQRHLFSAEQGKVVMHAGPDGQGCHYLLFDYAHAALARELLGPDARSRVKIGELVLACRQPDGSFVDTPLLGRAYGTAMALTALDALAD